MNPIHDVFNRASLLLSESANQLALCFDHEGNVNETAVRDTVPQIAVALANVGRGMAEIAESFTTNEESSHDL